MVLLAVALLVVLLLAFAIAFHLGPHHMIVSSGIAFAISTTGIVLLLSSSSVATAEFLWTALISILVLSSLGLLLGVKSLKSLSSITSPQSDTPLPGSPATAVTELAPDGVVKVGNETWSACSIGKNIPSGTLLMITEVNGLKLTVAVDPLVDQLHLGTKEV